MCPIMQLQTAAGTYHPERTRDEGSSGWQAPHQHLGWSNHRPDLCMGPPLDKSHPGDAQHALQSAYLRRGVVTEWLRVPHRL